MYCKRHSLILISGISCYVLYCQTMYSKTSTILRKLTEHIPPWPRHDQNIVSLFSVLGFLCNVKCGRSHGLRGLSSGPISAVKYNNTSTLLPSRNGPCQRAPSTARALMGVAKAVVGLACTASRPNSAHARGQCGVMARCVAAYCGGTRRQEKERRSVALSGSGRVHVCLFAI